MSNMKIVLIVACLLPAVSSFGDWHPASLSLKDNIVTDASAKYQPEEASTHKPKLIGEPLHANWSDYDIQKALAHLVERINEQTNSDYLYRQIPTPEAKVARQLGNGLVYTFSNLKMVQTDCSRHDVIPSLDYCLVSNSEISLSMRCEGKVYMSFNDVSVRFNGVSCEDEEAPAPKAGLPQAAHWNDDNVQKALSVLVGRVNARNNSLYHTLPTFGEVTKQLVNGMIYRFKNVRMVETSCTKNDASTKERLSLFACPVKDDPWISQMCTGEVYWSSIDKTFNLNQFECKRE